MSTTDPAPPAPEVTADLDLLSRMFRANQAVEYALTNRDSAKLGVKSAKDELQMATTVLKEAIARRGRIDAELSDYMRTRVPDPKVLDAQQRLQADREALVAREAEVAARREEIEAAKDMPMPPWLPPIGGAPAEEDEGNGGSAGGES